MNSAGSPLAQPALVRGSHRRRAAVGVFFAALAVEIAVFGLPLTPERFLLAPLAAAFVLGRTRRYVRDFLPFLLLIFLYEELRGVAHLLRPHPYYRPQIRIEEALFNGHLPSVELQHLLWTGHLRLFDHVIIVFSSIHFIVPPALAFFFWLKDAAFFRRFIRTYLALSFAGALTFLLFPAAPPWAASRAGVIRPVALISTDGAGGHGSGGTGLLLHNPYAAIPSLHAGYAMLVFLFVAAYVRPSRLRWPITLVASLYPIAMGFCVVYTGNHYVVDLLFGFAFAIGAFVGVPALAHRRALPSIRPRLVAGVATAVLALTLASALATAAPGGLSRLTAADSLSRSLAAAHTNENVDLGALLLFPWSRLYVFPTDATPQSIDRALGFAWPDAPAPAAAGSPASALLVFVRSGTTDREVVREIHYDGGSVGFGCLTGRSFARDDATFRIAAGLVPPSFAFERALAPVEAACLGGPGRGPS
jgi:membrane-associated phospholipid phosphatase